MGADGCAGLQAVDVDAGGEAGGVEGEGVCAGGAFFVDQHTHAAAEHVVDGDRNRYSFCERVRNGRVPAEWIRVVGMQQGARCICVRHFFVAYPRQVGVVLNGEVAVDRAGAVAALLDAISCQGVVCVDLAGRRIIKKKKSKRSKD